MEERPACPGEDAREPRRDKRARTGEKPEKHRRGDYRQNCKVCERTHERELPEAVDEEGENEGLRRECGKQDFTENVLLLGMPRAIAPRPDEAHAAQERLRAQVEAPPDALQERCAVEEPDGREEGELETNVKPEHGRVLEEHERSRKGEGVAHAVLAPLAACNEHQHPHDCRAHHRRLRTRQQGEEHNPRNRSEKGERERYREEGEHFQERICDDGDVHSYYIIATIYSVRNLNSKLNIQNHFNPTQKKKPAPSCERTSHHHSKRLEIV